MGFDCYHCHKELDIMTIEMDKDLRFVFNALPSFGTRYSHLVMGYCQLFGVTPFSIKSKKLRILIEEMKRLFDSQSFSYQKKTYRISHAGIAEALDLCGKKNFSEHLENHNYLKKVMMTIAEREAKDASRKVDADLREREDKQRAGYARPETSNDDVADDYDAEPARRADPPEPDLRMSPEMRQRNLQRLGEIIKSIG